MQCKMHVIAKCPKEEVLEACRKYMITCSKRQKGIKWVKKRWKIITIGKDEKKLSICDNDIEHIDEWVCERKEIWSKAIWKAKVGIYNLSICG